MAERFLRLDINPQGIFAAVVDQGRKQTAIRNSCTILFDEQPPENEDTDPFTAAVRTAAEQLDLTSCTKSVIFINTERVFFRVVDPPFSSENKIRQILPFELETVLPYSDESYINDFHPLSGLAVPHLTLTASIVESDIEPYFEALEPYGIKPVIITPKGYAAAVAFLRANPDVASFVFIYTDETETVLVIVCDAVPCFVRRLGAIQGKINTLESQVSQTLIGFEQRTGTASFFDIIVCDATEKNNAASLCNTLKSLPQCKREQKNIPLDHQASEPDTGTCHLSVLSDITPHRNLKYLMNFCRGKFATNRFFDTYSRHLYAVAGLAVAVFVLVMVNLNMEIKSLEKKIVKIDQAATAIYTSNFPDKRKIQDPYLQMKADTRAFIREKNKTGNHTLTGNAGNTKVLDLIKELSLKIPESIDTEISRLLFSSGQLIISGVTDNFNNVDGIKTQIESSKLFGNVTISSAAAEKNGSKVNFKFIVEI